MMERTKMEAPSVMLAQLQQLFSEVSEADIAAAEPKNELPASGTGIKMIGVATEEMRKWWVLAEAKSHPLYHPMDYFSLPTEERKEISEKINANRMNYDVSIAIFSNLASRMFEGVVAGGCLVMYKGWVIGAMHQEPMRRDSSLRKEMEIMSACLHRSESRSRSDKITITFQKPKS